MKRLVFVVLVSLAVSASLPAQQETSFTWARANQPAFLSPSSRGSEVSSAALAPELSLSGAFSPASFELSRAVALPEAPAPAPPAGIRSNVPDPWALAIGYEYVHFKSAPFSANMSGLHTSLAYALDDWVALEGSVVAAFGGDVFATGEQSRYVLYTGGARISWNREPKRWSPWVHALVGGVHVNPQTARSSKNGFAFQAGGGVDYFLNPRLSLRGEVDYVRTHLYSAWQNNIQAGVGVVLHF
ncbi:MAG TPA: outer membrane beta-barrel protein [Candidatus Acidoferrum sp.]|nr:outer membrane beta-barrel protein [Candidatus Acidoferrum sp.]